MPSCSNVNSIVAYVEEEQSRFFISTLVSQLIGNPTKFSDQLTQIKTDILYMKPIHIVTCIYALKVYVYCLISHKKTQKLVYRGFLQYVIAAHGSWFLIKGAPPRLNINPRFLVFNPLIILLLSNDSRFVPIYFKLLIMDYILLMEPS